MALQTELKQHDRWMVSYEMDASTVTMDYRVLDVKRQIWSIGSMDSGCDVYFTKDRCWIAKACGHRSLPTQYYVPTRRITSRDNERRISGSPVYGCRSLQSCCTLAWCSSSRMGSVTSHHSEKQGRRDQCVQSRRSG